MSYYVTNENSFLDIKNAHLRVTGNVHTDVLKVGSIGFQPAGSNIPGTVNFTNVITGVTTSSNLDVGGTLNLGTIELSASTHTLDHITARGNVTSTTVQFDNATTGLVTTANVEVGGELTVTGNVSDLNVVSNVNMLHTSNTASIKLNSNVVAEFPRSKKLIKYPRIILPRSAVGSTYNDYRIDRSSEHVIDSYLGVQDLFNNTATDGNDTWGAGWQGSSGSYSTSTGEHSTYVSGGTTQGTAARLASNVPDGEWVSLQLPNAIQLNHVKIRSRNSGNWYSQYPTDFEFWGSNNNGTTWSHIKSFSNKAAAALATFSTFQVDSTKVYSRIALVVTKIPGTASTVVVSTGQAHFSISELHLYGTPEYDPEAHGTDVVVKSVPNVPNTDWLEVYYDAKDLADGAVTSATDLSPNSNDGSPTDVNVSDGAFVFNGTSSLVEKTSLSIPGGDNPLTFSFWVKNDDFDNNQYIFRLGDNTTPYQTIALYKNSSNQIIFASYTLDFPIDYTFTSGQWNHISLVYPGGGWKQSNLIAYIDGRPYTFGGNVSIGGVGGTALSMATSLTLRLGGYSAGNTHFDGSIANFRLFNRALTSDEIYQLYAYQKEYFGHGVLDMTLKAGRLGIGTSEPRATLDVRGDIHGGCPVFFSCTAGSATGVGASMNWNRVHINKGSGIAGTTFTAPLEGYYNMNVQAYNTTGGYNTAALRWMLNGVDDGVSEFNQSDGNIYARSEGLKHLSGGLIVYMRRGDYIQVKNTSQGGVSIAGSHNRFNGFYLSS